MPGQRPSPKAASFVRPTRPANRRLSFLEAVHHKYAANSQDSPTAVKFGTKVAEQVGFDKIRAQQAALQELQVVLIDGLCVGGVKAEPFEGTMHAHLFTHDSHEIVGICPKVTELDLSRNLLETWTDVCGICKQLPALRRLVLE